MKLYNPIKAEDRIMNEPLTKDEQNVLDGFTLNKHDEATKNLVNMTIYSRLSLTHIQYVSYQELQKYINDMESMEKHFIENEKKMRDDYFELLKKHNEYTRDVREYFEYAPKFKELTKEKQIKVYQLQEKLSKIGNEN